MPPLNVLSPSRVTVPIPATITLPCADPSLIVPANDEVLVDVGVSVSVWPLSTTDVVFDASSESDASWLSAFEHEISSLSVHGAADAAERDAARIGNGIRDPERQRAGFDISRARIGLDGVEGDVAIARVVAAAVVLIQGAR